MLLLEHLASRTPGSIASGSNPHFHALVLEGGFDQAGRFIFIPLSDLARMTQYLRRRVVKFFRQKKLISADFAETLLRWRFSGFEGDAQS